MHVCANGFSLQRSFTPSGCRGRGIEPRSDDANLLLHELRRLHELRSFRKLPNKPVFRNFVQH